MAGIIPNGVTAVGFQLPIQSQSPTFVQPWEASCSPKDLLAIAKAADDAGFFYVGVCDHVATTSEAGIGSVWYDTIATLAWLGGQTSNVNLLSHVYVLPYRHPLVATKAWSTLDALTEGRSILGVGAGHLKGEFEALDVDYSTRGSALDDGIVAIRDAFVAAGSGAAASAAGRWAYEDMMIGPAPVRAGGPPIWVGGSSDRALRRAGDLGDGWLPQGPPAGGTKAAIARLNEIRLEAGRADDPFDLGVNCEPCYIGTPHHEVARWTVAGSADAVAERLRRYVGMGINQLQLRFDVSSAGELVDQIGEFGRSVLPQLQP